MASGFFNTLSDSAFIEGQTSTVRLDEEQPALVARLLLFAYTSSYPTTPVSEQPIPQFKMLPEPLINEGALATEWTFRAKIHAHMYQLADKYDMPLLKTQARQRFLISFQEQDEYTSEMDWIDADEWHHCDWTRTADVISYVYTEAPCVGCGLRDIVLDYYMAQIHTSNSYRPLIESAAMRNLVANTPGFAADVALSAKCDNLFKCESCDVKNEPSLAWRCGCGKVDSCDREGCIRRGKEATFCTSCYGLGCLVPMTDVVTEG